MEWTAWAAAGGWAAAFVLFIRWRVVATELSTADNSCRFLNGLLDKFADSRREERQEVQRVMEALKQAHAFAESEWRKNSLKLLRVQKAITEQED